MFPVIEQTYCSPAQMTLVVEEKMSFSGDDFSAYDTNGRLWFKMDSKAFSFNSRRTLVDVTGKPVLTLSRKAFSMSGKWNLFRGASDDKSAQILSIEPKLFSLSPSIKIYLNDGDREPDFFCKGDFRAKRFQVLHRYNGQDIQIAEISKESKFSSMSAFVKSQYSDKNKYFLNIVQGADTALIVALCVVVDELCHDQQ
eukprot:Partr_v1_DN26755_c1_g1_i4_m8937 putative Pfam:DUF567